MLVSLTKLRIARKITVVRWPSKAVEFRNPTALEGHRTNQSNIYLSIVEIADVLTVGDDLYLSSTNGSASNGEGITVASATTRQTDQSLLSRRIPSWFIAYGFQPKWSNYYCIGLL